MSPERISSLPANWRTSMWLCWFIVIFLMLIQHWSQFFLYHFKGLILRTLTTVILKQDLEMWLLFANVLTSSTSIYSAISSSLEIKKQRRTMKYFVWLLFYLQSLPFWPFMCSGLENRSLLKIIFIENHYFTQYIMNWFSLLQLLPEFPYFPTHPTLGSTSR